MTDRHRKIFLEETEFGVSLKGWIGFEDWDKRRALLVLGFAKKYDVGVGK